jgi:hypothetical protein
MTVLKNKRIIEEAAIIYLVEASICFYNVVQFQYHSENVLPLFLDSGMLRKKQRSKYRRHLTLSIIMLY